MKRKLGLMKLIEVLILLIFARFGLHSAMISSRGKSCIVRLLAFVLNSLQTFARLSISAIQRPC